MPVDKDALKEKYAAERDKRLRARRQRPVPRADRPVRPLPRRPVHAGRSSASRCTDHVTVAFIGGGFAGLRHRRPAQGGRASTTSASSRRAATSAAPGTGTATRARSATPRRIVYLPLLEETGHMPTREVRARARDPRALPAHRQAVRPLRQRAVPHRGHRPRRGTTAASRWIVRTNRGDEFTRPVRRAWAPGPLHVPKLPGHPRHRDVRGHSFHTSRWDYDYTGGDPTGAPMDEAGRQARRRSSAPARPPCSASRTWRRRAGELYVFQRTPSSVDVRDNHPTDPEWFADDREPGWQQRWLENFTANQTGGFADEDLVHGRLDRHLARASATGSSAAAAGDELTPENDDWRRSRTPTSRRWTEIRARVDAIVADPRHRREPEGLVPPAVQAAVLPRRVPAGVQRAERAPRRHRRQGRRAHHRDRRRGRRRASTRSTASSTPRASRSAPTYDAPRRLRHRRAATASRCREHWADGMRTLHGIHVHGFPNLFIVQLAQGANLISNVPHNLTEAGTTIAAIVAARARRRRRRGRGHRRGRGRRGCELLDQRPGRACLGNADCTPGYYNNEGQALRAGFRVPRRLPGRRDGVLHLHGPVAQHRGVRRASTTAELD